MELDQLKKKIDLNKVYYSPQEVKDIFNIRTKGAVASINRKMLIDAMIMIVATIALVSVTFALGLKSRYFVSGQIMVFTFLLMIHYKIKYHLLNRFFLLKNGLIEAINKSFNTLRYYLLAYILFIPVGTTIVFSQYIHSKIAPWDNLLIWLVSLIITVSLSKILYGKEYNSLKKLVDSAKGKHPA